MFCVVENMNFKLDPKYSFYRTWCHSSQRAVTVQWVDNAQLEKLSPFSHTCTSDKSQQGASSAELAAGQEHQAWCPQCPTGWRWCSRGGSRALCQSEEENGAETFPRCQDSTKENIPGLKNPANESLSCTVAFIPAWTGVCL